ncbi:hypothetical protein Tco_1513516, partial [Tanacetum coccineum]
EDDIEVDIEEDENEPELTYPYEEVDPLNPSPPASKSEPEDVIKVKNPIEHEDETIPASVYEVGNEVHSSMEQGTTTMEKLVERLGNAEDKVECKKLKKELKEARFSNTFLCMQNERVERDLYWTRLRAHEFCQEMIRRGFVFDERMNEAINVPIEDENSPSSEPRGSPLMPPKSAPLTQADVRRMIKESVDAAIAAERARHANARNEARGSDQLGFKMPYLLFMSAILLEGKKVKFATATLQGPALTWWNAKVATMGLETLNQMPWTEIKQLMTVEFCLIE